MLSSTSVANAYLHIKKNGLGSSSYNVYTDLIFKKSSATSISTYSITFPNKTGTLALTSDIGSLRVLKTQSEDSMFVYVPALEFRNTTLISIHTSPFMPDRNSTYVCFY